MDLQYSFWSICIANSVVLANTVHAYIEYLFQDFTYQITVSSGEKRDHVIGYYMGSSATGQILHSIIYT